LQLRQLSLGALDLREEHPAVWWYSYEVRDAVLIGLDKLDDIVSLLLQLLDALALYLLLGHPTYKVISRPLK
jgi:hypothetical protein